MIHRLAFVEVVVKDIDTAIEWYSRILGFIPKKITSNEDGRWCQLETSSGDNRLALWQPLWTPNPEGKNHPSFIPVFAVNNLRKVVDQLKVNKVEILEDIRERVGYRITTIKDLEKNQLQLFEEITSD